VNRFLFTTIAALALGACGDNLQAPPASGSGTAEPPAPVTYTDPSGGALRLIKDPASKGREMVLDLVVGDHALTGYSVGFDLPLDATRVTLGHFQPGSALSPGDPPIAAQAALPTDGPFKGMLVTAQSQKAAGAGAVATDTTLQPGTVLYTITLELLNDATPGVVFDGTAPGFVLPSGGMRDRAGNTVVAAKDVAIGKFEVKQN
jgi:hypothetical protein